MRYFIYRRFKSKGIDGEFNLKYGSIVEERDSMLYAPDGRTICAVTSENGWEHFRPNTPEGAYRQSMLDKLYQYYQSGDGNAAEDFAEEKWKDAENMYWKNLLRTMPTNKLTEFYRERLGEPPKMEVTICTK